MEDNLKLWNEVCETDPTHTKLVTFGRSFTSINAQYQLKQATKAFGKYGDKWGIKSIEYEFIDLDKSQKMALVKAMFFTDNTDNCFPVSTSILVQAWDKKNSCLRVDDEFAKKAETDITTKALSKLGFSADVFLGQYDDNRYVNSLKEKYKEEVPPTPIKLKTISAKSHKEVLNSDQTKIEKYLDKEGMKKAGYELNNTQIAELTAQLAVLKKG